jgi:hypothetical protein
MGTFFYSVATYGFVLINFKYLLIVFEPFSFVISHLNFGETLQNLSAFPLRPIVSPTVESNILFDKVQFRL